MIRTIITLMLLVILIAEIIMIYVVIFDQSFSYPFCISVQKQGTSAREYYGDRTYDFMYGICQNLGRI